MVLRVLILISLGLQLIGAFFLATQIVPKMWPERLKSSFQEKHQNLLKVRQMKEKQLENARLRILREIRGYHSVLRYIPGILLVPFVFLVGTIRFLLTGQVLTMEGWKRPKRPLKKKHKNGIIMSLIKISLAVGSVSLFAVLGLYTLYLKSGWEIVGIRVQRATYLSVEGIISYFSRRQGEEIFALLGIFLLAMGFVCQAIVNWIGIK